MNIKKYSPKILTIVGILGFIGTVVMAIKSTPKCEELLDLSEARVKEETKDDDAKLSKKEFGICLAKAYWSTAAMGVISTACFIASNYVSGKREALVATALGMSEAALHQFQESALEVVGKNTMEEIKSKVADKKLAEKPISKSKIFVSSKKGSTKFFDSFTGRYFESDLEMVRRVVNDLNEKNYGIDFVPVNDFYYELGLDTIPKGDDFGWARHDRNCPPVQIDYAARLSDDGEPCIVLNYELEVDNWRFN